MLLGKGHQQEGPMVRLLSYTGRAGLDTDDGPKEIVKTPSATGDNGWLIRFFDSAFFCEWIAVSYLYKYEHSGVRDYLCNRMYSLPLSGIESYLFQLCYMVLHMPSPSLEKYIVDMCAKSLRIATKVHWFLMAEAEDTVDSESILKVQERCQMAALEGDWPTLIRPQKIASSPGAKSRVFKAILSSRRLLPLTSTTPPQRTPPPVPLPTMADEGFREANRPLVDETESSLKVLKKFIPTTKVRDAFMKKFREKEEKEEKEEEEFATERAIKETDSDSFFKRLFRDKDEDEKGVRSDELVTSEGFFRRFFRDKPDAEEKAGGNEDEKDGFFRKLFREKNEEEEKGSGNWEDGEGPEFFLFRKLFRQVHPEEDIVAGALSEQEHPVVINPENSPGNDNFFKRLFLNRTVEDGGKFFSVRREGDPVVPSMTPSGFLRRLFKDRGDEEGGSLSDDIGSLSLSHDSTDGSNDGNLLHDSLRGMSIFRGKDHTHEADGLVKDTRSMEIAAAEHQGAETVIMTKKGLNEADDDKASDIPQWDAGRAVEKVSTGSGSWKLPSSDSSFFDIGRSFIKRPGSPKRRTVKADKSSEKPPLPKYSLFHIRKGVFHATLDFVQSLCDTSSGLADIFPMEDRHQALRESLVELNHHLVAAENDGGVCFPMGRGLYRVVHIPEDDFVLLNSREKAPYLICVEVLKCEANSSQNKDQKDSGTGVKLARRGIPLASGDAQLQRPPPWAYPLQPDIQQPNTQQLLRTASKAIDLAMAHLWETKLKVVDVSFSVQLRKQETFGVDIAQPECRVGTGNELPQVSRGRSCHAANGEPAGEGTGTVFGNNMHTNCRGPNIEEGLGPCSNSTLCSMVDNQTGVKDSSSEAGPRGSKEVEDIRTGWSSACCQSSVGSDAWNRSKDGQSLQVQGHDKVDGEEWVSVTLSVVPGVKMEDVEEEQPARRKEHRRVPSKIAMDEVKAAVAEGEAPPGLPMKKSGTAPSVLQSEIGGCHIVSTEESIATLLGHLNCFQLDLNCNRNSGRRLCIMVCPSFWEDYYMLIYTHCWKLMNSVGSHSSLSLPLVMKVMVCHFVSDSHEERVGVNVKATDALAGELWENKKERIRRTSKWSSNSDWDLRSMIVKSGDDCRQEHLAVQLVAHFYDIYQEAGLPLWLRPYEVLVTSSHTALIETIYDTASIHAIKSRNSNLASLRDFFCKKYEEGSPSFKLAQRNFVESMAGYSILCYFLQVKDRHNANLLLDEDGHIIHIDFGFMLSNSPGGVNFESAPFKLTRELLEVMDSDAEGTASEFFDYFKVLCIQGFLTCRKHAERIILLVEMMQDSGCPCFKGGPRTMQNLRKRFHLSLTEEQCVSLVLSLISSSLDAWRTRQYDYYQRVLNGIL